MSQLALDGGVNRSLRSPPRTLLTERGAEMAAAPGMIEALNAGRRRAREDREKRQALKAGTRTAA